MTSNNSILSDAQRSLLAAMLNRIVPAAGEMPAAGDLGIAGFVESVAAGSSGKRRTLMDGLVRIEIAASERGGSFADLSEAAQIDALRSVEASSPEVFPGTDYANLSRLLHQRNGVRHSGIPATQSRGL